jgi:hypothetical protein
MINPVVLAGLLRALSALSGSAKFKEGETVGRVLALAAFAVERGEAGRKQLEELCAKVDVMVAQGREPTDQEWLELRARSDAAHAAIQAAGGGVETKRSYNPTSPPVIPNPKPDPK